MNPRVHQIIELLHLKPHVAEGGFFRETYRSEEMAGTDLLPVRYKSARSFSTAIYYLLTPESFSSLHKLLSDEIFHFYCGDPVEMLQLFEDGSGSVVTLSNHVLGGFSPQVIVPKFTIQGARLKPGGEFALLGTTVSPGFDFEDYQIPEKEILLNTYPSFSDWIEKLFPSHKNFI